MGIAILCVSLLYSIFLNIIFFSKKHIKTYETKMFSIMVVSNLIGILLEFGCISSIYFLGTENILVILINKLFLVYLLTFAILFGMYAVYITIIDGTENKSKQVHNKIRLIASIFEMIMAIVVLVVPIELYSNNGVMYSSGPAANVVYFVSTICTLLCVGMMIFKFKNIKRKKTLLLFAYIIGCGAVALIQQMNPALTLATSMETFLIFLMYNTIENPDVKMIHQLDVAKEQADKANHAKTDFLSSMSHEIRTPLNAIVGFSDYIMSSNSLEEAKENAQDIVNASKTLLEIVNGILDISKIEAGKLEIVNSKYNAKQTFEGLAKLITPKMQEKGLDFSYYIAPDLPDTLFGDHANLKKIITNLLSNAYKYTDKGSVRYEVNCINSNNISKLIITVEDTGRGIKQESIDKLFTKFQRLDEDRNTTIEGTGLGLAITKQLIELMGGKILVHTVYGEGSKFTVVLNQSIEKTPVLVEQKTEIKTTLDLKDKKILLVDDNSLNIKVANKILERFNANNITSLDNGFDCIELIKSGKVFDIILMDDMMPKMSGVETFHKLKELDGFNQPVVILTANAITGMKEKYLSEGFEDYLAKPIEKDELIRVCNTIFSKYQTSPNPPEEDEIELLETTQELELVEPIAPSKESYLRENKVDLDKALELLGDIEMYNMTISDFLSEVEEKWQNIINYKDNNDMENYAIEVHSLKSDAKYLGFMSLADISYQHELKSKENDSTFVQEHFTELETEYNKALNIAKTYNEM
ncbi:MAG: response regulator [Bacilli bacterium]|nr:response regulator [Bacilli bacterium]